MKYLSYLLIAIGVISIIYYIHDILSPSHFVGDMYGLELMFRIPAISISALIFALGIIFYYAGLRNKRSILANTGMILMILFSLILLILAFNVFLTRYRDNVRNNYKFLSSDELIRIPWNESGAVNL